MEHNFVRGSIHSLTKRTCVTPVNSSFVMPITVSISILQE